ncbi:hypothetical protein BLOT_000642 [Blomia tropicalis]|nr:hypothetical protein BLOT_000642 [Blomia tropicalis]
MLDKTLSIKKMINEQLYFNAYNEQVLASEKPKTIFKKIIEYIIYIWSNCSYWFALFFPCLSLNSIKKQFKQIKECGKVQFGLKDVQYDADDVEIEMIEHINELILRQQAVVGDEA